MKTSQDLHDQTYCQINRVKTRQSLPPLDSLLPHFKRVASIGIRPSEKFLEGLGNSLGEKLGERWSELSENQRRIITLISENPRISRRELAERLNMNQSAIQKHIEKLKKNGLLRCVGPAKGGHWEIIE